MISGFAAKLDSNIQKYMPGPIKRLAGYNEPYKENQASIYLTARDLLDLDDLIAVPFYKAVKDKVKPQERIWNKHVRYHGVYREGTTTEDAILEDAVVQDAIVKTAKVEKEGTITMEGIKSRLNNLQESLRKDGILSNDDVLKLDSILGEEQIARAKELEAYLLQEPIFDILPAAADILKAQYLFRTYHEIMPRFVAASYDKDANLVGGRWSKPILPIHFFPDTIRP